ncbi:triose-phosphate isomerase [Candidatus Mycoplasma haematominutum]|uniref:Triosephosphate isomerase n=1 Tax=Candidatus Mycoplasma haematominutum 'Birmingham 1' TaxID=1116213 RepID=G8C2K8_9MOLU|nr:triose-phosphate isomerase family protein [Candidatus Mycoplasma haematominutum]CCE66556.1 triosephosphate isomerase [Candidatus Mycoplasma haematominutum 'Birmingham 1']
MATGGKKLIIGNLKMNLLRHEFDFYCLELRKKLQRESPAHRLGLAIPYIYLERVNQELGSELQIFSQDVHHVEKGAYTSSISATQLSSINVYSTLIGHSECRLLGQSEEIITKKVRTALLNGFNIVYCCGKEPLKEIKNELFFLNAQHLEKIIIAFEPITAIGSGIPMAAEVAAQQLSEIRKLIIDMWGEPANRVRLLYGGSVNKSNYKDYLKEGNIDGILVGSAALNIHDLWDMAMER